jgi:dTDP-glucose 4,6-dehydratase
LCRRLVGEGYRVIALDNLITGSLDNLEGLKSDRYFVFKNHNVSKFIDIRGKVDFVLHFASLASPEDYLKFPIQTLKAGSLGTHNALGLAKEKKAKFLLASTSEVYGDPYIHPQPESYWGHVNPVGVRGCYDESKRFAEAITMAYYRVHKINTAIARIFNTYGEHMRNHDGRVVPNFICQALKGRPLTVYGKGTQSRSFCYIDDMVEGLVRLMRARFHEPVNLGNPDEFTVKELAGLVLRITGSKSKIVYRRLPQDDPRQRQPDIARAKQLLGWRPKVKLEEGIKRTINWFKGS